MAVFKVTTYNSQKREIDSIVLNGHHEEKVSIFVRKAVTKFQGPKRIRLSITSLPSEKAKKVKIVGIYITKRVN